MTGAGCGAHIAARCGRVRALRERIINADLVCVSACDVNVQTSYLLAVQFSAVQALFGFGRIFRRQTVHKRVALGFASLKCARGSVRYC